MEKDARGIIADIQRFSLHDGPGIRTTVFLKGCNMRCPWCHNPETIDFRPQVLLRPEKCIHCGGCAEGCYAGARVPCGTQRSVGSVLEEVLIDSPFYGEDGGVTLSGGEPLCQAEFAAALLQACRASGMRTAVESNLAAPWSKAGAVLKHCDLLMADLKLWDEAKHLQWTGIPNKTVKENFLHASQAGIPIVLRTPVVPGVNDDESEIRGIAGFAKGLSTLLYYELLPYHPLGLSKGIVEGVSPVRFEKPSGEAMKRLAQAAAGEGIPVRIAGVQQ